MHWLDRAAAIAARATPHGKRPFNGGWGDESIVEWYLDNARNVPPLARVYPAFRPARRTGSMVMRDLTFESPFEMLTGTARTVHARLVTDRSNPRRLVIIHAGWNDEDYATRMRFARDLLGHGIASLLPLHPMYGERRPQPGTDTPCPTVSDFALMGRGGVLEGRSLAEWAHREGYEVGVTGYSMGGNIAGFVGVLVPFPVAISAIAAPYSARAPFLEGLLRATIAWDALGGETPEIVERMSRVLNAGSLLNHEPPPHAKHAVLLAGTRDGFVPTASTQEIVRHWPGAKMDWVNAGHASLLFRKRDRIIATIVESFDRLAAHRSDHADSVD